MRWIWWMLVLFAGSVHARTLHVPTADFPTVQAGLDSVQDDDTVAVSLGTYTEALLAPPRAFVLRGDVVPDTGDYPRPLIDPSMLQGSRALGCLILPINCRPTIEDLRFRNGPEMYPHSGTGGVAIRCGHATFRRCIFDSVSNGLQAFTACSLAVESCRFLNVWESIYSGGALLYVNAVNSSFTGDGWAHIVAYGGADIEQCAFGICPQGPLCLLSREVKVTECQFGPYAAGERSSYPALDLYWSDGRVENNLFTQMSVGWSGFVQVTCACDDVRRLLIRHNQFVHSSVRSDGIGNTGLSVYCADSMFGSCGTEVDSNLFFDNSGTRESEGRGVTVALNANINLADNYFRNLRADTADVHALYSPPTVYIGRFSKALLSHNRFDSTGFALFNDSRWTTDTIGAKSNWWGDASGPYNSESNAQGLGDTIIGYPVNFGSWCLDTSCAVFDAVPRSRNLHPTSFSLSASPNPFNSTTLLHLEVPEPQIVRVELFDLLGRRVKELWSGVVAEQKEITFDGSTLASGVYFVRATNTIWNRPLISGKIVLLK